ncbi:pyrroline-5-carboxylate reductase [Paenibacillus sp. IB182496]|uniref:Pyrroline-5-carboxylate reductase n=1 Tax=Paenibacillus sabuli TaxID=2772509 RepID=A0A927GRW5_9BACL|nr:pyrroline-5-carboxylate reductase [Paenibacillus sabuli]MBD2845102.1 pyrroline-5-carboxylate reductase [Paenibacillus sabuli]
MHDHEPGNAAAARQEASGLYGKKLAFYGAGSMAEAIVRGLLTRELTQPQQITMINRADAARLEALRSRYGVQAPSEGGAKLEALKGAEIVVLAMKPKDAAQALRQFGEIVRPGQLLVSVIAGLRIAAIERLVGRDVPIVRTMPNTSSTIGLGVTGISFSERVSPQARAMATAMFEAVGTAEVVDEPLLDAVTAVSGSGPAYAYYLMEQMIAAGQQLGLDADAARALTVQTLRGAAEMVLATGEQPAELRRKVMSPGGTTEAAIRTLDAHGFPEGVQRAMARAAERAGELGDSIEEGLQSS